MNTIVSINKIKLKSPIAVYDIEVPKNSNFVVESGVVVHNSTDIADSLAGAHLDAMNYKEEFMFFHPDDYDYEGLNNPNIEEQRFKEDMVNMITGSSVITSNNSTLPSGNELWKMFDSNILTL